MRVIVPIFVILVVILSSVASHAAMNCDEAIADLEKVSFGIGGKIQAVNNLRMNGNPEFAGEQITFFENQIKSDQADQVTARAEVKRLCADHR